MQRVNSSHTRVSTSSLDFEHAPLPKGTRSPQTKTLKYSSTPLTTAQARELFVNATCKFVTCLDFEITPYLADSDALLPWDKVEYVVMQSEVDLTCPICLGPPVAAKVTRCGHVYCWHCILHHLAVAEKSWNFCPLCEHYVYKRDLRSVQIAALNPIREANVVSFHLKQRFKGSNAVLPRSQFDAFSHNLAMAPSAALRVQTVDLAVLHRDILSREARELHSGECDASDPFVQEACTLLALRTSEFTKLEAVSSSHPCATPQSIQPPTLFAMDVHEASPVVHLKDDSLLFYQASDESNSFLEPIMMRVLLQHFGSYEALPDTVEAPVIEVERITVDEQVRARYKVLSHLPLGCSMVLCELDLRGVVSPQALTAFAEALHRRELHRRQRQKEERRLARKAHAVQEAEMNSMLAMANQSFRGAPSLQTIDPEDEFFKLPSPSVDTATTSRATSAPSFAVLATAGIMGNKEENPSLLDSFKPRGGQSSKQQASKTAPVDFPSPSSPVNAPVVRSVWGTAVRAPAKTVQPQTPPGLLASSPSPSSLPTEDEGIRVAPSYQQSFRDSLDVLIDAGLQSAASKPASGKKGKKKGVLLFSTSIRGASN
eukprot:m.98159 g.98159  ORF g.98159 m.98159 type:complete len:601 (+) comp51386_c0_seq2:509-2311(+)